MSTTDSDYEPGKEGPSLASVMLRGAGTFSNNRPRKKRKKQSKSLDSTLERSRLAVESVQNIVRKNSFAYVPFVTEESELHYREPFCQITLYFMGKQDLSNVAQEKFWNQVKQPAYNALLQKRNAVRKGISDQFIELYRIEQGSENASLKLENIRQGRANQATWLYVMTGFLRKIIAGYSKKCPHERNLEEYCPATLEAYLFLCLENYHSEWESKANDANKRHIPRAPWTKGSTGNGKKFCGWSQEGIDRFNEIVKQIETSRSHKDENKVLQDSLRNALLQIYQAKQANLKRPQKVRPTPRNKESKPRFAFPKDFKMPAPASDNQCNSEDDSNNEAAYSEDGPSGSFIDQVEEL